MKGMKSAKLRSHDLHNKYKFELCYFDSLKDIQDDAYNITFVISLGVANAISQDIKVMDHMELDKSNFDDKEYCLIISSEKTTKE